MYAMERCLDAFCIPGSRLCHYIFQGREDSYHAVIGNIRHQSSRSERENVLCTFFWIALWQSQAIYVERKEDPEESAEKRIIGVGMYFGHACLAAMASTIVDVRSMQVRSGMHDNVWDVADNDDVEGGGLSTQGSSRQRPGLL